MRLFLPTTAAVVAMALATVSCAANEPPADDTTQSTVAAPTSDNSAEEPAPTTVMPQPDLLDRHQLQWESWSSPGGDLVTVEFWNGTPECYGADVEVTETAENVTINLFVGTKPEARDMACIAIAVYTAVQVELAAPLGDREVRQDSV